ncbi:methionyl-tRNA formyltransferase [Caenimonas terrae]|uniref:Methionyl-tRNA formyltransferase n=1 Tax=Caenimonas terrae TaxID=696074 RepID=A0ABW0NF25_9BURK
MKIAFIGHHDFGKAALDAFIARGDTIAGVFCAPEKPGEKPDVVRLAAQAHGLPLFQLKSLRNEAAVQAMRELDADLGVMAYVLQFASQEFVNTPRHGTIQYHPSLLPLHRGPSSINWPISLGATATGLTIFRPTDGLDEGPVILQRTVAIGPDETLGDVYFKKLFPLGVQALLEASTLVVAGQHTEQPQDESQASYEGWFHDEESKIHWGIHVDQIYNLIRACNPAPGAWTRIAGEKVHLYDSRKRTISRHGQIRGKPGEITAITQDAIVFDAHGGEIKVLRVRPEGGAKMNAGEFARLRGLVTVFDKP